MNNAFVKFAVDALEPRRCDATVSDDLLTLASLLDDDLTFVHSSGRIRDKPKYLTFLSDKIKAHEIVRGRPPVYGFRGELVITLGHLKLWLQRRNDGSDVNIRALVTPSGSNARWVGNYYIFIQGAFPTDVSSRA